MYDCQLTEEQKAEAHKRARQTVIPYVLAALAPVAGFILGLFVVLLIH